MRETPRRIQDFTRMLAARPDQDEHHSSYSGGACRPEAHSQLHSRQSFLFGDGHRLRCWSPRRLFADILSENIFCDTCAIAVIPYSWDCFLSLARLLRRSNCFDCKSARICPSAAWLRRNGARIRHDRAGHSSGHCHCESRIVSAHTFRSQSRGSFLLLAGQSHEFRDPGWSGLLFS